MGRFWEMRMSRFALGFDLAYLSSQKIGRDYINVRHAAWPMRLLMNLVSAPMFLHPCVTVYKCPRFDRRLFFL